MGLRKEPGSIGATPVVTQSVAGLPDELFLTIYVSSHCSVCAYAYEVAELIRRNFSQVHVHLIDIHSGEETIPEAVFATPTYLLNGHVWSLGNPSAEKIQETFWKYV